MSRPSAGYDGVQRSFGFSDDQVPPPAESPHGESSQPAGECTESPGGRFETPHPRFETKAGPGMPPKRQGKCWGAEIARSGPPANPVSPGKMIVDLNDRWRVTEDGKLQWILQHKEGARWRSRSFFRTRLELLRDVGELCGDVDPQILQALGALPPTYDEFLASMPKPPGNTIGAGSNG